MWLHANAQLDSGQQKPSASPLTKSGAKSPVLYTQTPHVYGYQKLFLVRLLFLYSISAHVHKKNSVLN